MVVLSKHIRVHRSKRALLEPCYVGALLEPCYVGVVKQRAPEEAVDCVHVGGQGRDPPHLRHRRQAAVSTPSPSSTSATARTTFHLPPRSLLDKWPSHVEQPTPHTNTPTRWLLFRYEWASIHTLGS